MRQSQTIKAGASWKHLFGWAVIPALQRDGRASRRIEDTGSYFANCGCSGFEIGIGGCSRRDRQPYTGFPKIERLWPEKKSMDVRKTG